MIIRVTIVLLGLFLSLFLFKKAAATLDIGKINIVSYIMYFFLLQTYIGASLVYLGDKNHYTMKYMMNTGSYDIMYYSVLLTAILFPLTIIGMYKLLRVNIKDIYSNYLEKEVDIKSEKAMFFSIAGFGAFCCIFLLIFIIKIKYFPLIKLLTASKSFPFDTERIKISGILIINQYVKSILIDLCIPLLSYVAFTYAIVVKKLRWTLLTVVLVGASIVAVTSNFEKVPIIFYLFVFLLILMYVRGGISRKMTVLFVACMVLVLILYYVRMKYDFFSGDNNFYNGPIGRTIFTQVGTLTMHFDLFPSVFSFLGGRSFSPTILSLFGIHGSSLRSGKLVMDFYGSDKVYGSTGGVMNAFFIGESYANFGFLGMALSIIYLGVFIALFFYVFLKIQKTPFNIAVMAFLTSLLAQATQGGFTDFVYNFKIILIFVVVAAVHFIPKIYKKWIFPKLKKA